MEDLCPSFLLQIVMAPYQGPSSAVQVVRESEAADIIAAVAGLIRIFKKKLWTLPSSHAIQVYGILIACLECHYRSQAVLDGVPRVRQQVGVTPLGFLCLFGCWIVTQFY